MRISFSNGCCGGELDGDCGGVNKGGNKQFEESLKNHLEATVEGNNLVALEEKKYEKDVKISR